MVKFHVNSENGTVSPCEAKVKACPIGGAHYSSNEDAVNAKDKMLSKAYGALSSMSKPNSSIEKVSLDEQWTRIPGEGRFKDLTNSAGEALASVQLRDGFYILGARDANTRRLVEFEKSSFTSAEEAADYFNQWLESNPETVA